MVHTLDMVQVTLKLRELLKCNEINVEKYNYDYDYQLNLSTWSVFSVFIQFNIIVLAENFDKFIILNYSTLLRSDPQNSDGGINFIINHTSSKLKFCILKISLVARKCINYSN